MSQQLNEGKKTDNQINTAMKYHVSDGVEHWYQICHCAHYWLETQKQNPNQNQNVAEHLFWHIKRGGTYLEQLAEEESHLW